MLAETAADLLPQFTITTKVGFFPDGHDLHPARLRAAVDQAACDLGRVPDTVLIHNPECSLRDYPGACDALAGAQADGLCGAWGISTWDPRPLLTAPMRLARPQVLMTRAGLTVPTNVLDAGDALAHRTGAAARWGMAPFGGRTGSAIWIAVDTTLFLAPGQKSTALQSGVAAAFHIPPVTQLAIGTSQPRHLAELAHGAGLIVNLERVNRYRALLRRRSSVDHDTERERTRDAALHG